MSVVVPLLFYTMSVCFRLAMLYMMANWIELLVVIALDWFRVLESRVSFVRRHLNILTRLSIIPLALHAQK